MKQASLILGLFAAIGMFIGFIPCFGWLNWLNIPVAVVGLILGLVDYNNSDGQYRQPPGAYGQQYYQEPKKELPVGVIICGVAVILCTIRLFLGAGII